jgi:hypothetical protein
MVSALSTTGAVAQTRPQCPAIPSAPNAAAQPVSESDIPVAHTSPGGYRDAFPAPVLATCTEPLVDGAPDLRGLWRQ